MKLSFHPFPFIATLCTLLTAAAAHAATVGVNFSHGDFAANTGIQPTEAALGIPGDSWFNFAINGAGGTTAGTGSASNLSIAWNASNAWSAGSEGVNGTDASQQVFRMYLDDGDGGSSYFNGDGFGASVQISGLSAFMAASTATSYSLTLYFTTDASSFTVAQIRQGLLPSTPAMDSISSLTSLGTIDPNSALGDGTYPFSSGAQTNTQGHRGVGTLSGLTADAITIAMPVNAGNGVRGSLAGFSITAVPEPSATVLLGGLGLLGVLRRRR